MTVAQPGRVLVTGGAGFLGLHLAKRLLREGWRVTLFDRQPPADAIPEAQFVEGDMGDAATLQRAFDRFQPNQVVHLAAVLTEPCAQDPVTATRVNCLGTATLFSLAADHRVRRAVFASSVAVFGRDPTLPRGDDRPFQPSSVYGATKVFGEHLADAMMRDRPGLDLVGLRFGWVYGPGRVRGWNELQDVVEGFALERAVVRYPDYTAPNDWTYVDDAVEAIILALGAPRLQRTAYNVSGDCRTIGDAVAYLQRKFPAVRAEPFPAALYPNAWDFVADGLAREAGYRPRVPLEDGLDRTVAAIRAAHGLPPAAAPLPVS